MSNEKIAFSELFDRLRKWFASNKKTAWIWIAGLCGIALIGGSALFGGDKETVASSTEPDAASYAARLEERLGTMVSSIQGAGKAQVMVTLENGVEYVYASEEKSNSDHSENTGGTISVSDDSQKTVVTIDDGNGKSGLLVTEIQPTVRGVVVACEGAGDPTVCELVRQAVKTALNITDQRVCVIPYNN